METGFSTASLIFFQISLLIILNESQDAGSLQNEDMVPCAQAVMDAASRLILVAKQQAQSSTDQVCMFCFVFHLLSFEWIQFSTLFT